MKPPISAAAPTVVLLALLAACAPKADPAAEEKAAEAKVDAWAVSSMGAGPVRIGMTAAQADSAAGGRLTPKTGFGDCGYARPSDAPAGLAFMIARDTVARVDVDSAGVETAEGVKVGDPEGLVWQRYSEIQVQPGKHAADTLLVIAPARGPSEQRRLIFVVAKGVVRGFRAGRLPEVEWVERCG